MGIQYTLSYLKDQVDVESIEAGALNITENHYYRYAPGVITSSWSEADAINLSSEEVLFTIVMKAKSAVRLRDVLSLNSRVTPEIGRASCRERVSFCVVAGVLEQTS